LSTLFSIYRFTKDIKMNSTYYRSVQKIIQMSMQRGQLLIQTVSSWIIAFYSYCFSIQLWSRLWVMLVGRLHASIYT